MALNVWASGTIAGTLSMAESEPFYSFTYDETYLSSSRAHPLSLSLPLRGERFSGTEALPYFEGLLPEGQVRDDVARQLHVSPNSPSALIRELGRDCAGDVVVLDQDEPYDSPSIAEYAPLEGGLSSIADDPYQRISKIRMEHRLSLAGGQEKIALFHDPACSLDTGWYVPVNGSPSSHIIKPQISPAYPDLALNEYLCMSAAAVLGINTSKAAILPGKTPLLVVERFDRKSTGTRSPLGLPVLSRTHQEDFSQALGIQSAFKYEEQKTAYLSDMSDLVLRHAKRPIDTLAQLFRLLAFNFAIGNCDAHLKNYSLLHDGAGRVSLAPAYDLVSTAIYDGTFGAKLSRSTGIRMGSHANIDKIDEEDVAAAAATLRQPKSATREMLSALSSGLHDAMAQAVTNAEAAGFANAGSLAERILASAEPRLRVLTH